MPHAELALATATTSKDKDGDLPLLVRALEARRVKAQVLSWDDGPGGFHPIRLTVLRSTWNYVPVRDAFLAWAESLDGHIANAAPLIRWNTHKSYLRELDLAGLPVVPTVLVPQASGAGLAALMHAKGWDQVVAKPAVGAGSLLARCLGTNSADAEWFATQVRSRDMLIQPFLANVATEGEYAFVYLDGALSHVMRKGARFADEAPGALEGPVDPPADLAAAAEKFMRWLPRHRLGGQTLYARVDLVRDDSGAPRLLELEATEPNLFLRYAPGAMERFAEAIARQLEATPPRRVTN